jgi:hypothetical protein
MHLEIGIGAVVKELRATKPEISEAGDVLLGRRRGAPMKVDGRHVQFPCRIPLN